MGPIVLSPNISSPNILFRILLSSALRSRMGSESSAAASDSLLALQLSHGLGQLRQGLLQLFHFVTQDFDLLGKAEGENDAEREM